MSQSMSSDRETVSTNSVAPEGPNAVQIGLRLRASDNSGRAIVSNISSVHLSSGMAFIDFGFIEQSALSGAARAARGSDGKQQMVDGRLECRIAMGLGDVAQLARQLQQMLANANRRPAPAADADEHMMHGPETSLQ